MFVKPEGLLVYIKLSQCFAGSVVEHPFRDREVVGSNPGRAIPKALKMVPVATLLGAQHYKASTGFSSPNKILLISILIFTFYIINQI